MIIDCSTEHSPDEQWLTAYAAYNLVCARNGSDLAASSIVKRAHERLVRTRAERASFEIKTPDGGKAVHTYSNALLPKEFWWAEDGDGLHQNWQSGDFSTLNEGEFVWKAFGVCFDLPGIQAMLAPDQASDPALAATDSSSSTGETESQAHQPPFRTRTTRYPWSEFEEYAAERLDYEGGYHCNWIQADLEREMMTWCKDNWDREPSVRSVRNHLEAAHQRFLDERKKLD